MADMSGVRGAEAGRRLREALGDYVLGCDHAIVPDVTMMQTWTSRGADNSDSILDIKYRAWNGSSWTEVSTSEEYEAHVRGSIAEEVLRNLEEGARRIVESNKIRKRGVRVIRF